MCWKNSAMTETVVLEQYAQALQTSHRAKTQLRRSVQAHQAAVSKLSAAELELQSAKLKAADELQQHMKHLQKKLKHRFKQALNLLEQEYQLQQLPLKSTTQLLQTSIANLEQSVARMQLGLQQQTPARAVQQYTATMHDIHSTMQRGQAAIEHSRGQVVTAGQHRFECVMQFKQLRVTSSTGNSCQQTYSSAESYDNDSLEGNIESVYAYNHSIQTDDSSSINDFNLSGMPAGMVCGWQEAEPPANRHRIGTQQRQQQQWPGGCLQQYSRQQQHQQRVSQQPRSGLQHQQQQQHPPAADLLHDDWRHAAPPVKQLRNASTVQHSGCTASAGAPHHRSITPDAASPRTEAKQVAQQGQPWQAIEPGQHPFSEWYNTAAAAAAAVNADGIASSQRKSLPGCSQLVWGTAAAEGEFPLYCSGAVVTGRLKPCSNSHPALDHGTAADVQEQLHGVRTIRHVSNKSAQTATAEAADGERQQAKACYDSTDVQQGPQGVDASTSQGSGQQGIKQQWRSWTCHAAAAMTNRPC